MRVPIELPRSYRLINHGPTTLISAAHAGQRNVMAAAWAMPLDFSPPKVAVVIAADTHTRKLIEASGAFVVAVPTLAQIALVDAVGNCSGKEVDKFQKFAITASPGSMIEAPLIDGCASWMECRVMPEPHMEKSYDLFVGEVIAAWVDDEVFSGGRLREDLPDERRSLHHIAGGNYVLTGRSVSASR